MDRRTFLQTGLAGLAWLAASRGARAAARARARSCILLYMEGGPSQLDTFDPKPGRPTGGEFKAIATAVAGVRFSEHLPLLAKRARELAVVRSMTSKEGNHLRARHLMHTGYPPQGGVDHPALGSLVAGARPPADLPGYVAIGGPGEDAGFLSPALSPFVVQNAQKGVRQLAHAGGIDDARFAGRMQLWRGLEDDFAKSHPSPIVTGGRAVGEQAIALLGSRHAAAFQPDADPSDAYGASDFGTGCRVARQLVEAGVPFVEVTQRGWDTHRDNFATVKSLSADLDRGFSALLDDLKGRGLLSSTLVVWLGDFGRTPQINANGGRDHWPKCQTAVLAGGGVRGGVAIGETDADGTEIRDRPTTVPDLFRTIAVLMGLDPDEVRYSPAGRPIKTVDGGKVIDGLV
jgi:uncharacterized protein (DUF1501 family)